MPTPTYTPLANITLGSSAANVTFSSISQAYRDLRLVIQGTATSAGVIYVRINGDSGSNYSRVFMLGDGSSPVSGSDASTTRVRIITFQTSLTDVQFDLMDYTATDKHKSSLSRGNNAGVETIAVAGRWASTSAVTSLLVALDAGNLAAGTSLALYGIAS